MKKILVVLLLVNFLALAKDPYVRNAAIDIQRYTFQIEVNDSTDVISGKADVLVLFKKSIQEFELDLVNRNAQGKGMEVSAVTLRGKALSFTHKNDRLKIVLPTASTTGEHLQISIAYRGVPLEGFVISRNKFGDRGFYGDNWPDRGHHWLPVIDHPSDKAAVDFIIIAPQQYTVVANGIKVEESALDKQRKLTHWHEEMPIPVKVMVTGIARFSVQYVGKVNDIAVESWVFPQNKAEGFKDYAEAINVLDFFNSHIGPYPFKKLANVQSKTAWGGLENASAIFYAESSVNGKADHIGLIAHEEAHQWFGDSASEDDWHHAWLSEGFATYFSNLYLEYAYGHDKLVIEEKKDRDEVIAFHLKNPAPVVDTTIVDLSKVLSVNSYQKGGWVLHMLRHQLGDAIFWKGIRQYYATYRFSNALTGDFQRVMEDVSGADLSLYFKQWLYQAGHPEISATWQYDAKTKAVSMTVTQLQGAAFQFPLEIGLVGAGGHIELRTAQVNSKSQKFSFPIGVAPERLVLDPDTWLLFEGTVSKK